MLKLGRYLFEQTPIGFEVYTENKKIEFNGKPLKVRCYTLNFRRCDHGHLYWSVFDCKKWRTIKSDKAPKTITNLASDISAGHTIFNF